MNDILDYEYVFPGAGADAVKVAVSSELMTSYATGRIVDTRPGSPVAAVRDPHGNLAVLSAGDSGHLFLVRQSSVSATGWEQHDLSARPAGPFDAAQDRAGNVAVYAVLDGKLCHTTLAAAALAAEGAPEVAWNEVQDFRPPGEIVLLRVGPVRGPGTEPLVIVMARHAGRIERYAVNGKRPLHFPNEVEQVFDALPGQLEVDGELLSGIFALYRTTSKQTTIGFAGQEEREYEFVLDPEDVPPGARALAVAPNDRTPDQTDLYVGGAGVWRYDAAALKEPRVRPESVAPAEQVGNVTGLVVRNDAKGATAWAFAEQSGTLFRIARPGKVWAPASPVHADAAAVAAIRRGESGADEFAVVGRQGTLTRGWLDARTKLWTDTGIPIRDDGKLQTFNSYTTVLHLEDGDRRPLSGREFELGCSERMEATVNGAASVLDSAPVKVKADPLGRITIVSRAATLTSAVLTLTGPGGLTVPVDPAKKVRDGLAATNEAELGKRFPGASAEERKAAATALERLSNVNRHLPADGSLQLPDVTRTLLSAEEAEPWGISFAPGGVRLMSAAETGDLLALAARTGGLDFFDLVGDALRFIKNTADKIVELVVEGAKAIIQIGTLVINFAVESVSQALAVMHTVLEKIGATMEKLVGWLGFVFDWDDILTTHKVITNVAAQTWTFGRKRLDTLASSVDRFFKIVDDQLASLQLPEKLADVELFACARKSEDQHDPGGNRVALLTRSPAAAFAAQHLTGAAAALDATFRGRAGGIESDIGRRLETLFPEAKQKEIVEKLKELMLNFGKVFTGGTVRLSAVFDGLKALLAIPVAAARAVVGLLIEFARQLLDTLEQLLTSPIEDPFLATFYAKIAGGDRPFTLLNAMLLLAAIPATAAYKLVTGSAPFPSGKTHRLATATADEIFGGAAVAAGELKKETQEFVAAGEFINSWAVQLLRGVSAAQVLSEVPALSIAGVLLLIVIVVMGVPATTPIGWDVVSVFAWGYWLLDAAAMALAWVFALAPKAVTAVIDIIGLIISFLVGFAGSVAQMVHAEPKYLPGAILGAVDVFAGLAADSAIIALVIKDPAVVAIAGVQAGLGTHVSSILGTIAAILNAIALKSP